MKNFKFLVFCLFQIVPLLTIAQNKQLRFERIGIKEGLSDPIVLCMMQDSRGFIWVGTRRGLNRYDGHEFRTFINRPEDSLSLVGNYINKIIEDTKGNLWIATTDGLGKFERKKYRFSKYINQPQNPNSLAGNNVTNIIEDGTGKLWLTTNNGINLYNPETNHFIRFSHNENDSTTISDNFVTAVFRDRKGELWFGTQNGGLNKFVSKDSTFIHYQVDKGDLNSISENSISTIFEDKYQRLWIGTARNGLNLMNRETGKFRHFKHTSNTNSIGTNNVLSINEDDNGNLLIGTENGGICLLDSTLNKMTNYIHDDIDESSLSANSVYSILKDKVGNIWVGVFAGGINLYKKSTSSFNHFKHNSAPGSLSNNFVLSIYEDHADNLWIGTDGGGLNCFDRKTGKTSHYEQGMGQNSIAGNSILTLAEDDKNNLWIGTWGNGISKLDLKTRKFTNFNTENTGQGLSNNNVYCITVAKDGKIWIGTFGSGLDIYDPDSNSFIHFENSKEDKHSLSDDKIYKILEDKNGKMWIGTAHGGINLFDPGTNSFIRFDEENGNPLVRNIYDLMESRSGKIYASTAGNNLIYIDPTANRAQFSQVETKTSFPSECIYASLEDLNGDIWMSSNKGISKFDIKTKEVIKYSIEDGLQADEFKPHSAFCSKSGLLYFGGINGYNSFYPGQIIKLTYDAPVVLTDFQIFNKSVSIAQSVNDPSPLKQDISETKSLTLQYDQSVITFEFAALDYSISDKKVYAYMLEGFDQDWNYITNKNSATYTNLSQGDYIFKVRSQGGLGEWSSKVLQLNLTIVPPFWLTWWFKLLMGLVLVIVPIVLVLFRIKRLNNQKELLAKSVDERTLEIKSKNELLKQQALVLFQKNDQLKELNSTKDKLFSIIGHDLRSPFSAILGFQDLLINDYHTLSDEERLYMLAQTNTTTNQVYSLVENLLSWARIQSNSIQHFPVRKNVKEIILEKYDLYHEIAKAKGINLDHQVPQELMVFADINLIETILRNLISNAIKFTPPGGSIFVRGSKEGDLIKISVIDSGVGMSQEQIDNLCSLEKTESKRGTNGEVGSGLGLVLCKELAEKNGGTLSVESQQGIGSTFSFTIPAASENIGEH